MQGHRTQGSIALFPGPGFNAFALPMLAIQPAADKADWPTRATPPSALLLTVREPSIGLRAQAMMDMQGEYKHTQWFGGPRSGVQQGGGIPPSAVSHCHDLARQQRPWKFTGVGVGRHGFFPPEDHAQRSVVSEKRP